MRRAVAVVLVLPVIACGGDPAGAPASAPVVSSPATAPPVTSPSTTVTSAVLDTSGDVVDAWLDTSTWVTYGSERYGFTITHPPTWTVIESSRVWDPSVDSINWDNGATEVFVAPDGELSMYLAVWAVQVDPATTLADWAQAFCDQYVVSCTEVEEMSDPASTGSGARDAVLLAWDDGIVSFIPSWYDPADPVSIWQQPAPAGARIHLVESGRPDGGPHRAREFVEELTRSLCVACAG